MFKKWYRWSQYPCQEKIAGLTVDNPRYALPPKIGGYFHSQLIDFTAARRIDNIRKEFPFDLIDAHWAYPAGVWAVKLGQRYDVPVVITGRGEDMARFPQLPIVGDKIRWALKKSSGCIGVSQEISSLMIKNGANARQTRTIANGIDIGKFHPKNAESSRQACGLPADRQIILSVGDRLELKGFHLIVQAMATVRKTFPRAMYVILGGRGRHGRDYTRKINEYVNKFNLHDHVRMVGPKPHDELIDWYNAADLYAMMSSREGSPNVLLEALACGTPAIGTAVGGICDELSSERVGRLVPKRSADAAATAIIQELKQPKCRSDVAAVMQSRTWHDTASCIGKFFQDVISDESHS